MSSPMIDSPTVARVAVTLLTLLVYAGAVCLPAFLLWWAWQGVAPVMLELAQVQK
jgi:hypothetical protein